MGRRVRGHEKVPACGQSAAMVSLHSGVLSPDGLYEVPARGAPTDPSSLIAQLRDLAAQLYALTEP